MANFNKFNQFVGDVGDKVHNLNADTLKIMLTNTLPVATNAVKADITEISAVNGYSAGGATVGSSAYSQTSGTAKLTGNAVAFAASGGDVGPFQYAVLYNDTPSSPLKPLIGWWTYASPITLHDGETFKVAKDTAGGNWDSSTPILTLA
jgi:hypothetical protein